MEWNGEGWEEGGRKKEEGEAVIGLRGWMGKHRVGFEKVESERV